MTKVRLLSVGEYAKLRLLLPYPRAMSTGMRVLRRYKRTLVSGQISAVYCGILFDFNSTEIKLVFTVQLKMAPIRYVLIGCIYFDV